MKKLTLRLAITLLTFFFGIAITWLLTIRPFRSTETDNVSVPTVVGTQVKSNHPEGWEKIVVDNRFSFYLPPDMKTVDSIGCPFGDRGNYGNQSLGVGYDYIPSELIKYGYRRKLSCERLEGTFINQTTYRISEVEIGGKRARLIFRQSDNPKNHLTLCFPDLGDGAILRFGGGSDDERTMNVVKQIFDSIEFQ